MFYGTTEGVCAVESLTSQLSVCGVCVGLPMWWLEANVWRLSESLPTLFIEIGSLYVCLALTGLNSATVEQAGL